MFHAPSKCLAMSPPVRFVIFVGLVLLAFHGEFAAAESCHAATNPIYNDGFHISCSKEQEHKQITILCKELHNWDVFPANNITLKTVNKLIIQNCSLPQDLTLSNLTRSFLKIGKVESVEFDNLPSTPTKEFFDGYNMIMKKVTFRHQNPLELPNDLFRGLDVEYFEVYETSLIKVPANFFKNSMNPTNLEDLSLVKSKLTKLSRDDFDGLDKLIKLYLFGNEISEIEEHTFDHMTSLQVLELSDNRFKTLPANIFKRLSNLNVLNLGQNEFDYLPADLLRNNSKLFKFRINSNRGELATLPNGFFKNLRALSVVELTGNNFTSLPEDSFLGSISLLELHLSNNHLVTLAPGIFESTNKLKTLSMDSNKLESLPDGIFEDADLRELSLDNNRLTSITTNVLFGLEDLKILRASNNQISYVTKELYTYLNKCRVIDFSHNNIALELDDFNFSLFVNFTLLEKIDLSYNQIAQMPDDWYPNAHIEFIDLEGNNITELTIDKHFPLNNNSITNLKNNKIHTVHLDYEKLKSVPAKNKKKFINPKIFLDDNPLNCSCKLLGLSRYLQDERNGEQKIKIDIEADELECHEPQQYKSVKINYVPTNELSCLRKSNVENDECNKNCTCWDYPSKSLLLADCSYKNFKSVPHLLTNPNNWSIALNMSGNMLRQAPELNQSYLLNVTSLDLSYNNISTMSAKVFSKSLRDLRLHNNRISRLDSSVVNALTANMALNRLTLHHNKWECTCELRGLLKFINKNSTLFGNHLNDIKCERTGQPLFRLSSNELCNTTKKMVQLVVSISLVIAFFGIIMGVVVALYYKYEMEIKIWLYAKQWCMWLITEDDVDKNKKYDAFVSFSHKDEEFVQKEIVPRLEEGPKPFKLCLHYRDWLAGEWIPNQIVRSVEESRRTIIILSPDFLESVWGITELRVAYCQAREEKRIRVIPILYGDIGNIQNLDPEIKAYLSMNTYLKWGEPGFWDRLKYAMPHRNEPRKRKSTNARAQIVEMHLSQTKQSLENGKSDNKPGLKVNESDKLLEATTDDEKIRI